VRAELRTVDRALLAAAACHLPRSSWGLLLVTPGTLLRWHQALDRQPFTPNRRPYKERTQRRAASGPGALRCVELPARTVRFAGRNRIGACHKRSESATNELAATAPELPVLPNRRTSRPRGCLR
jgi:hypothetical protein